MSMKVWRPLDKTDTNLFLYHYTTMEKAYNILCTNELWFSNITNTNDIFEQKAKISFLNLKKNDMTKEEYNDLTTKINYVREYMNKLHLRVKLLCFSRDWDFKTNKERKAYETLQQSLSIEQRAVNVIGRGFSLPRMWAQYASDNKGVCFVFNKNKILEKVRNSGHSFMFGNVVYNNLYKPYSISPFEFNSTYELITKKFEDSLSIMIHNKNKYLWYDLFNKLSDWSSENEFRIILTNNCGEGVVKIRNIGETIEGIVFGARTDTVNEKIICWLGQQYDVRKLVYEDIITKIVSEK